MVGFVWFAGLNLLSHIAPDAEIEKQVTALKTAHTAEAVLLGGSAAGGVDLDVLGLEGAELWQAHQDIFEATTYANLLLDRDHNVKYWIIALSPPSQALNNGSKGSCCGYRRHKTYRTLRGTGEWGLVDQDWRGALRASVSLGDNDWIHLLRFVGLSSTPTVTYEDKRSWELGDTIDPNDAQATVAKWREDLGTLNYYDTTITDRSVEALSRLNKRIQGDGAKLILISPPMHDSIVKEVSADLSAEIAEFENVLSSLAIEGAVVMNDLNVPEISRRNDFFMNTIHLNRKGAAAYSQVVAKELSEKGVLPLESFAQ